MTCLNCHQPTDDGAAFCGNCGQPLQVQAPAAPAAPQQSPIAQVIGNQPSGAETAQPVPVALAPAGVPAYAVARPGQHAGETKALLALIFGIAGLAGVVFMALIGLVLGFSGIIMGTMSRSSPKRGLSTAGLVFSSLAVLAGLGVWAYAIRHDPRFNQNAPAANHAVSSSTVTAADVATPCYSAGFVDRLNVANNADSCDMNAFDGKTLAASTNVYKVYADTSQTVNAQNYAVIFKAALEKDVKSSLPGFTIDSEAATTFAGSPAYVVSTSDKVHKIAVVEAAVFHQAGPGENVFILVHGINGPAAYLTTLEAQWQWK